MELKKKTDRTTDRQTRHVTTYEREREREVVVLVLGRERSAGVFPQLERD